MPDDEAGRQAFPAGGSGMRITTDMEGSWRTLLVMDADPGQRRALAELGFGPDLVLRYPPDTRYFDRAVANLRRDLDEMVQQKITGTPAGWAWALDDLLCRAGQARIPLALVGSAALAARGVGVRPGDIDVITTTEGADMLADSYQETLVMPLATSPGFGRWSRAFTGGIRVEWLGNPARAQEGSWPLAGSAWTVASPLEEVSWKNRILRVPPLEVQRRVEVYRQRPGRVTAIDEYRSTCEREPDA
jgi:hypothetical protein